MAGYQVHCCYLCVLFFLLVVSNALQVLSLLALFMAVKKYMSKNVELQVIKATNISVKDKQEV